MNRSRSKCLGCQNKTCRKGRIAQNESTGMAFHTSGCDRPDGAIVICALVWLLELSSSHACSISPHPPLAGRAQLASAQAGIKYLRGTVHGRQAEGCCSRLGIRRRDTSPFAMAVLLFASSGTSCWAYRPQQISASSSDCGKDGAGQTAYCTETLRSLQITL